MGSGQYNLNCIDERINDFLDPLHNISGSHSRTNECGGTFGGRRREFLGLPLPPLRKV